jgi:hypothetical protein
MEMEEDKSKRFLWGMLLAWIPWVPLFFGLHDAFKGASEHTATGFGALFAGLQFFAIFGMVVALAFGVAAIVLLVRAVSRQGGLRSLFSILSICSSTLMIFLVALMLWLWATHLPPAP